MKTAHTIVSFVVPAILTAAPPAVAQSTTANTAAPPSAQPQTPQPEPAPTEEQRSEARGAMARASTLFDAGRHAEALALYQRADEIMHVPSTAWNVANTLHALGRLTEAREKAVEVAMMPKQPTEPRAFQEARQQAQALVTDLDARIPSLLVMVEGTGPGEVVSGAVVTVDGVGFDASVPRKVDPGRHQVHVTAQGYEDATVDCEVPEGARESTCVVPLQPKPPEPSPAPRPKEAAATVPPSAPLQPPPPPPEPAWYSQVPTLAWVGFGVGAAGLGVGAATGALAWSKTSKLKDDYCAGGTQCSGSYSDEKSSADTLANVSNVAFAVGVLGAGLGVYALLQHPGEAPPASAKAPEFEFQVGQQWVRLRPDVSVQSLVVNGEF